MDSHSEPLSCRLFLRFASANRRNYEWNIVEQYENANIQRIQIILFLNSYCWKYDE